MERLMEDSAWSPLWHCILRVQRRLPDELVQVRCLTLESVLFGPKKVQSGTYDGSVAIALGRPMPAKERRAKGQTVGSVLAADVNTDSTDAA
jgi:hypothetical protein